MIFFFCFLIRSIYKSQFNLPLHLCTADTNMPKERPARPSSFGQDLSDRSLTGRKKVFVFNVMGESSDACHFTEITRITQLRPGDIVSWKRPLQQSKGEVDLPFEPISRPSSPSFRPFSPIPFDQPKSQGEEEEEEEEEVEEESSEEEEVEEEGDEDQHITSVQNKQRRSDPVPAMFSPTPVPIPGLEVMGRRLDEKSDDEGAEESHSGSAEADKKDYERKTSAGEEILADEEELPGGVKDERHETPAPGDSTNQVVSKKTYSKIHKKCSSVL